MARRFIALPVGQGDAFFYQDGTRSVLVDGGKSRSAITTQLQAATSCSSLDVLVCTHNDADHANGVLGVLESGLECSEVWLPSRWIERLADLLVRPEEFEEELYMNWRESRDRYTECGTLDKLGDQLSLENQREPTDDQSRNSDQSVDVLLEFIEQSGDYDELYCGEAYPYDFWPHRFARFASRAERLPVEALTAVSRIRQIVLAARHFGSAIKWFQFGQTNGSQVNAILSPLNCREILRIPPKRLNALEFAALSVSNRESLVFAIPSSMNRPGVVFSSDSDFGFPFNLPGGDYLVTAPHHGSESNARAYTELRSVLGSSVIVRSDGRFQSRPGKSFLAIPHDRRFCTLCRGAGAPKQTLEFHSTASGWAPATGVRACNCR